MSRFSAAPAQVETDTTPTTQDVLFKQDRPRRIDHFIDYFGGTDQVPPGDACGDAFLEDIEDSDE